MILRFFNSPFSSFAMKKTILVPLTLLFAVTTLLTTAFSIQSAGSKPGDVAVGTSVKADSILPGTPIVPLPFAMTETDIKRKLETGYGVLEPEVKVEYGPDGTKIITGAPEEASNSDWPERQELAFLKGQEYDALLYTHGRSFGEEFVEYRVKIFNKKGTELNDLVIASTGSEFASTVSIDPNCQAVVRIYKVRWVKPYEENELQGNSVRKLTFISKNKVDLTLTKAQGPLFQAFLTEFPTTTLPYEITAAALQANLGRTSSGYSSTKRLSYKYAEVLPEMERGQFSRMPVHFLPLAKVETDRFYAVVFSSGFGFSPRYADYYLTLFDKNGNLVTTKLIAFSGTKTLASCVLKDGFLAEIKEWQVEWTKDYETNGAERNSVKSLALLDTHALDLTQNDVFLPRSETKVKKRPTEPLPSPPAAPDATIKTK